MPLVVAGEGPDEARLRGLAAGAEVRFTGRLAPTEALRRAADAGRRRAAALALGGAVPYAVLDALAAGVPVLAGDRGGLPELVGEGATVAGVDPERWAQALADLWRDPGMRRERGEQALGSARERFGEERHLAGLMRAHEGG